MKVLVCGGRDYMDANTINIVLSTLNTHVNVYRYLSKSNEIDKIITGGARGADELGAQWARMNKISLETYKADWEKHGRSAGYLRNSEMLKQSQPDIVVAFPGGRGTAHMVKIARDAGYQVLEIE